MLTIQIKKVVLVTGSSRGIGQAIALMLGRAGATIIGTATTEPGAAKITAELKAAGIQGQGMVLDLRDIDQIKACYDQIVKTFGAPAILVNNAGLTRDNLLLRMKTTEWDEVIQTNLSGVYHLSKLCIKSMIQARWGRIINISSIIASTGNAGQINYAAAKAGLLGLSKSLAQEVGSRGITVNVVAPGFIDTDMTRTLPVEQTEKILAQIPLARLGDSIDVAHTVAFLASDMAAYITGHTLHVNGGLYMGS